MSGGGPDEAKVVFLRPGDDAFSEGQGPDADVIGQLESLLKDARAGRLTGIAYVTVDEQAERGRRLINLSTGWYGRGVQTNFLAVIGLAFSLTQRMTQETLP